MPYRFLEDVAWADVAFEVRELSLPKLFESAGRALTEAMVRNPEAIRGETERHLRLEADSAEKLLHQFLDELVFLKDAERLVFGGFAARVEERAGRWHVDCLAVGEPLDTARHESVVDVKAVTWHRFEVVHEAGGWRAQVVLDV